MERYTLNGGLLLLIIFFWSVLILVFFNSCDDNNQNMVQDATTDVKTGIDAGKSGGIKRDVMTSIDARTGHDAGMDAVMSLDAVIGHDARMDAITSIDAGNFTKEYIDAAIWNDGSVLMQIVLFCQRSGRPRWTETRDRLTDEEIAALRGLRLMKPIGNTCPSHMDGCEWLVTIEQSNDDSVKIYDVNFLNGDCTDSDIVESDVVIDFDTFEPLREFFECYNAGDFLGAYLDKVTLEDAKTIEPDISCEHGLELYPADRFWIKLHVPEPGLRLIELTQCYKKQISVTLYDEFGLEELASGTEKTSDDISDQGCQSIEYHFVKSGIYAIYIENADERVSGPFSLRYY